ncbi:FeoC-like transcriptional regulator [Candidatus Viridilinea mediisalina]|uniref:Transcriptional regulator HTH-type FeoC domain-containing protein n=1 Tax=Candidatus Viridilinea mediisalina TaxID=2024553 RepID=A0A2A6RIY3_9CHLR|nr:FeoC-like transcriptional regulator [Candidatus Viridilinea mediisalina]PDW02810.1 hypothetical protein CJ255_12065 [Candidatus Viridilinea mediisalina]
MLHQVLHAFESADGPLALDDLSRQLGIERSALEGMIAFWVRKGRLQELGGACGQAAGASCTCSSHPAGCSITSAGSRVITLKA